MSIWTHVCGVIRVDDFTVYTSEQSTPIKDLFILSTFEEPNKNCNVPCGSEGSIKIKVIEETEDGHEYMKTILIYGDLRDYDNTDCKNIETWWHNIPNLLGKARAVRNAVLRVDCEEGLKYNLDENNMEKGMYQ